MKKNLLFILTALSILLDHTQAGALIRFGEGQPDGGGLSLADRFWDTMDNFLTGALHLVGSVFPLRGMATVAKDMGLPYAEALQQALTPDSTPTSSQDDNDQILSFRDELSSAIGTLIGKSQCNKRLACLSGRHLSHINGASSIALMVSSASHLLPDNFREPLSTLKDSIMYSDNCEQYQCN